MPKTTLLSSVVLLVGILSGAGCGTEAEQGETGPSISQWESLNPKADAFLQEVNQAWGAGDYRTVLAGLDSAARHAPELAEIPFWRGRAYVMLNRLSEARASFESVLALDPSYPGAWYELGNIDFRERQYRSAVEDFEREEEVLLRILEKPSHAADLTALAATRLQMGRAYNRLGEVDRAYDVFRQALDADSTFADAYYELGRLYEVDGEIDEALNHARRAYAANSSSPDNQYLLGALLLQNGQPAEARPYLEASVAKRPWYHPALNNLGRALLLTGQQEEAEYYLARAEEMQQLQTRVEQARLDVQQDPSVPQKWIELAELLVHTGRYDEAEDAFNKAIYLEPMNLAYHNDAANLTMIRGDTLEAIRRFRGLVEFDSTFTEGWLNLGVAYAISGRYVEAEKAWKRVLEEVPDHPEAKTNLDRLSAIR